MPLRFLELPPPLSAAQPPPCPPMLRIPNWRPSRLYTVAPISSLEPIQPLLGSPSATRARPSRPSRQKPPPSAGPPRLSTLRLTISRPRCTPLRAGGSSQPALASRLTRPPHPRTMTESFRGATTRTARTLPFAHPIRTARF